VAVCGEANFADETVDTLLNPVVIIEVLSTSTADYDRGKKAQLYRRLESLQDYVIVAQTPYYVEHYHRQTATQWLLTTHTIATDNLVLHRINASIAMSDIYDKIDATFF
jgi:Uma2 family endonuclease